MSNDFIVGQRPSANAVHENIVPGGSTHDPHSIADALLRQDKSLSRGTGTVSEDA
jgi:hypothetical protein